MIEVYRLTFRSDGAQYVGQTRVGMQARLVAHRRDTRWGSKVGARLRAGAVPGCEILSVADTPEKADTLEARAIAALPDRLKLNTSWRPRQNTPVPPVNGCYRCAWCGQQVPVEKMAVDNNRSRGRGSKCAECYRAYCRIGSWLKRRQKATLGRGWLTRTEWAAVYAAARGIAAAGRRDLTYSKALDGWWWDHCDTLADLTWAGVAEYVREVKPEPVGVIPGRPGGGWFYGWTDDDRALMMTLLPNLGHWHWHWHHGTPACGRSLYERAAHQWLRRHPDRTQADYLPRVWFDLTDPCGYQPASRRSNR